MSVKEVKSINLVNIVKREMTRPRHPQARRLPTFYPSSASVELPDGRIEGGCWRADWYRVQGVPESDPTDLYMSMIYKLGKSVEDAVVEAMKCAGVFESAAVKFYDPELNVSGELDVVGRYRKSDGTVGYFIVECKSVYGQGASMTISGRSRAYKGQPAYRPKPKNSNVMQTMVYLNQFSKEKGPLFHLDGAKLVYFPRDKPVDGREYTIYLVTKEELLDFEDTSMSKSEKAATFKDMKEGRHYALIMTDGFPDYVETTFALEDMYDRWKIQKAMFTNNEVPPRPFKKSYSRSEIEYLVSIDELAESALEEHDKGRGTGHFLCRSYCSYRGICYHANGQPNKAADIPKELVQIEEMI